MTSDYIYRVMVALGMTQAQFAVAVGCRREAVNSWVRGRTKPSPVFQANIRKLIVEVAAGAIDGAA